MMELKSKDKIVAPVKIVARGDEKLHAFFKES